MQIGAFSLLEDVLIVAEIGNNHEGDVDVAKTLVRQAAACGVHAVKFQTFRSEHYVSQADAARFSQLKSFELSQDQFRALATLARSLGLLFLSTPFDLASVELLDTIVDGFKIASGDNTFYPLLAKVAATGKPMIISSGLSDFDQVQRTVSFVREQWREGGLKAELAVLHCVSSYPVPPEQANLAAIPFLAGALGCPVGYSDHTIGTDACMIAVALGARIIEKHFTLDKHYSDFRDHQLSADPAEMRELVRRVRLASSLLGAYGKTVQPCEQQVVHLLRRSVVAGADLPQGHHLTWSDLTWIRPAGGLPPGQETALVGKTLKRSVRFGELLTASDVD